MPKLSVNLIRRFKRRMIGRHAYRTAQNSISSEYGPTTTAQEVIAGCDLSGKVAVVTGGHSGLGLETVRILSKAGAFVVVPSRNSAKAKRALSNIPQVEQAAMDLLDPVSVHAFAHSFLESHRRLHILINNAGIMAPPLMRDSRGYESQLATNHLGHFQLAVALWPALRRAQGARIISMSSRAHRRAPFDFEDPNFERRPYDRWLGYGQSKTANALFAVTADSRGKDVGVRAFSVHPGMIPTDLTRHLSNEDLEVFGIRRDGENSMFPGRSVDEGGLFKTVEQGAATSIWCATSPKLDNQGGVYCEDVDITGISETTDPSAPGVRPWAVDVEAAERLWSLSEMLVGLRLEP